MSGVCIWGEVKNVLRYRNFALFLFQYNKILDRKKAFRIKIYSDFS